MTEPTFSKDTMNMTGPVCDGSTADYLMYCDALCAEQAGVTEDALFEALAAPGELCAFCGKQIEQREETPDLMQEMYDRIDHDILTHPGEEF